MMERTELRELRAEFKELAGHPDQPRADWCKPSNRAREWRLAGSPRICRNYAGLAKRAAALSGLEGLDGWLDLLAAQGTLEQLGIALDGAVTLHMATLEQISQLSVTAIDDLLAKHALAPVQKAIPAKKPAANTDTLETFRQGTDPQRVAVRWHEAEPDGKANREKRESILRDFNLKLKIRDRVAYDSAKAELSRIRGKLKVSTSTKRSKGK